MNDIGLDPKEIDLILGVFRSNPAISEVLLYGSRAKGNYRPESDIDLALLGVTDELLAEQIADELDELPLPYKFDVRAYDTIRHEPLREHIDRVGIRIYRRSKMADLTQYIGTCEDLMTAEELDKMRQMD